MSTRGKLEVIQRHYQRLGKTVILLPNGKRRLRGKRVAVVACQSCVGMTS